MISGENIHGYSIDFERSLLLFRLQPSELKHLIEFHA